MIRDTALLPHVCMTQLLTLSSSYAVAIYRGIREPNLITCFEQKEYVWSDTKISTERNTEYYMKTKEFYLEYSFSYAY